MDKNYIRKNINQIDYIENKNSIDTIILELIKKIIQNENKNFLLHYIQLQNDLELLIKCLLLKKLSPLGGNIVIETEKLGKEMIRQLLTFYLSNNKIIQKRKGLYTHNEKITISQSNFNGVFYQKDKEIVLIELLKTIYHEVEHHKQIALNIFDSPQQQEKILYNLRINQTREYYSNQEYTEIEISANINAYKEILKDISNGDLPFLSNITYINNQIKQQENLREKEEYQIINFESRNKSKKMI